MRRKNQRLLLSQLLRIVTPKAILSSLAESRYRHSLTHGSTTIPVSYDPSHLKTLGESEPTTLRIMISDSVSVNCHCFILSEIELDIDPREFKGQPDYDALLEFLAWLADAVGCDVHLAHENSPEFVITSVSPPGA